MFELNEIDLAQLSPAQTEARLLRISDLAEGLGAGVEVRRGFIHDFVLRLHSVFGQALSDRMDVVGKSLNPLAASLTPGTEPAAVEELAAYYGLSRVQAVAARGLVKITVNQDRPLIIGRGTIFTSSVGQQYYVPSAYAVRSTDSEIRSPTDRKLTDVGDGQFDFTIPVVAASVGAVGRLPAGSLLTLDGGFIPGLVRVEANFGFYGGQDQESDASLISRIRAMYPAKALSSRASLVSYLSQPNVLPNLQAASTIGYGDEELLRNRDAGFNASAADVYLRSDTLPETRLTTLTATVTAVDVGGTATWTIPVGRDVFPGFYRVGAVVIPDVGQPSSVDVERGMDLSPIRGEHIPKIENESQAAFSRFQTATITVRTPSTGLTVGDTAEVEVELIGMPDIAWAQSRVSSRAFRFIGGDTLVRAAIPTFVAVNIEIHARPGVTLSGAAAIRIVTADFFNSAGFPGKLHQSRLAGIINSMLPGGAAVHTISAVADTILPDGSVHRDRQTGHFEVPDKPEVAVTARTATFFVETANVTITPYTENIPAVI